MSHFCFLVNALMQPFLMREELRLFGGRTP